MVAAESAVACCQGEMACTVCPAWLPASSIQRGCCPLQHGHCCCALRRSCIRQGSWALCTAHRGAQGLRKTARVVASAAVQCWCQVVLLGSSVADEGSQQWPFGHMHGIWCVRGLVYAMLSSARWTTLAHLTMHAGARVLPGNVRLRPSYALVANYAHRCCTVS